MQLSAQHGEQAGFARAIWANQTNFIAGVEGYIDAIKQGLRATGEDDLLQTYHINLKIREYVALYWTYQHEISGSQKYW